MRPRVAAVVFACAMLSGCARDDNSRTTAESAGGAPMDTSDELDDVRVEPDAAAMLALLRELANRDEALIEMARLAITRREPLQVSADARRMLAEQRRESNRLLGSLKGEYHVTYQPTISARDQAVLDSLNGLGVGEFDNVFLAVAAKHHEDDVAVIDTALPNVKLPRLREMLAEIRAKRSSEAAAFRRRLGSRPSAK